MEVNYCWALLIASYYSSPFSHLEVINDCSVSVFLFKLICGLPSADGTFSFPTFIGCKTRRNFFSSWGPSQPHSMVFEELTGMLVLNESLLGTKTSSTPRSVRLSFVLIRQDRLCLWKRFYSCSWLNGARSTSSPPTTSLNPLPSTRDAQLFQF